MIKALIAVLLLGLFGPLNGAYDEDSLLFEGTYTDNFVIRWGYQERCYHCHDMLKKFPTTPEGVTFDPKEIQPGDILFVRNAYWFFRNIMPKITCPFVLVTAGEYKDRVLEKHLKYLNDEKIIAWFTIHPYKKTHPKLTPIPLGIYQKTEHYRKRSKFTKLFAQLRQQPKEKLLYMNFRGGITPPIRADRDVVHALFIDKSFCYKAGNKSFANYMKEMAQFKFVLSPSGTAPDTYRTWEALLAGSIPIVKTSHLDELYANLPILIVQEWEDVTQEFLEQKYAEITSRKYAIERLHIDYWWDKIEDARRSFLEAQKVDKKG